MKTKKGIALVMANAEYIHQNKLPACKKDGQDIRDVFEYLNFDVISGLDLKRSDMYELISRFIDEAKAYSTVLVYYSGHGVQIDGENYFVPVDCEYKTSTRTEHLEAHDGNWQNPTNWYYNPVTKEKFDFGDGPFIPCEIIQLPEPIISLTRDSTIQENVIEEKEDFSKDVLKQSAETNKKTYSKPETSKSPKVQVEVPKKANNMFVKGLKSVGRFIAEHPVESLEIAGVAIGGVAKAISSIKGSGSGKTRSTTSASGNSSVAEKVADIVEKASRSLPSENDVTGHKQRYHTKNGVVWKDKAPYHRGGK